MSEPKTLEGTREARSHRVAVVAARFNDFIVGELLQGALTAWREHGGDPERLVVARVPGAFEIPVAVRRLAASGRFDAVVALGCVVRGDTPHFQYVAGECARGLQLAALETGVPVAFGVLTVDSIEQARERSAPGAGNKGAEAMDSALEMADLFARM